MNHVEVKVKEEQYNIPLIGGFEIQKPNEDEPKERKEINVNTIIVIVTLFLLCLTLISILIFGKTTQDSKQDTIPDKVQTSQGNSFKNNYEIKYFYDGTDFIPYVDFSKSLVDDSAEIQNNNEVLSLMDEILNNVSALLPMCIVIPGLILGLRIITKVLREL